jgi:hypothetical protein
MFTLLILMIFQWSLEAVKWKILLQTSFSLSFRAAFWAVFRGIAVSVVTPNRMGEFLGRILHLPKSQMIQGMGWTFISNLAQLLVTLVVGSTSLFLIQDDWKDFFKNSEWSWVNDMALIVSVIISCIALLTYWGAPALLKRFSKFSPRLSENLQMLGATPNKVLFVVLLISVLRFSVFVFQYWIFFVAMEIPMSYIELLVTLSVLFLLLAVIPTFTILELGLRWQFALLLFASFQEYHVSILFIITWIWGINFIIPSILGALDFLRYRPFKN